MAVRAADNALTDLGFDRLPAAGDCKPRNGRGLVARIDMVEVKRGHIALAAVDARVARQVRPDPPPVVYALSLLLLSGTSKVNRPVAFVVVAAIGRVARAAVIANGSAGNQAIRE
jgi:hypothetical protein